MPKRKTEQIITIVGSAYFQPIADLIGELFRGIPDSRAKEFQTSVFENGYSVSICVLLVLCFESYAMRVYYIKKNKLPTRESALDFLIRFFPKFPHYEKLIEAFVLRDLIAHNHLWMIDFSWNAKLDMKIRNAVREEISGDRKYRNCVDFSKKQTKKLHLNIIPTNINRTDVSKILRTIWDALLFLEKENMQQCYVSNQTVWFKRKIINFDALVNEVEKQSKNKI